MARLREIEAYRKRLSKIARPSELSSEVIGAVVTVRSGHEDHTGTLVAVQHALGMGLCGPVIYTEVKLCPACVHRSGGDQCFPPSRLPWLPVQWLTGSPVRNGDAEEPRARPVLGALGS